MIVIFAVSDAIWLALIGVLAICVKEYFDRQRAKDAAVKVELVRADTVEAAKTVANKLEDSATLQDQRLVHLAGQMNGLKDELVKSVKEAAFAAGQKSQLEIDKRQAP
jgi:hypothetical protein